MDVYIVVVLPGLQLFFVYRLGNSPGLFCLYVGDLVSLRGLGESRGFLLTTKY